MAVEWRPCDVTGAESYISVTHPGGKERRAECMSAITWWWLDGIRSGLLLLLLVVPFRSGALNAAAFPQRNQGEIIASARQRLSCKVVFRKTAKLLEN